MQVVKLNCDIWDMKMLFISSAFLKVNVWQLIENDHPEIAFFSLDFHALSFWTAKYLQGICKIKGSNCA